jgi:hypothetical protein
MRYVMTYARWTALVAAHAARNPQIDPRAVRAVDFDRLRREDVTDGEEKLADSIEEMSKAFFELAGGAREPKRVGEGWGK